MNTGMSASLAKQRTWIEGFDQITSGGFPEGRVTLIAGPAGSGKTVFATHYLAAGVLKANETGVFVAFEETAGDIRKNMEDFGWEIQRWEDEDRWVFVDASFSPDVTTFSGDYTLDGLLARIERAVQRVDAKRVVLDSLGAFLSQFPGEASIRQEFFRIISALKKMGVTSVITAEAPRENQALTRYEVEEFVADNVLVLRHVSNLGKRRRTVEILKFRGAFHEKGEFPFSIVSREGIVVLSESSLESQQASSGVRIPSGNDELDRMCGGGFFRDSIVLVSGATGTGKTLMATEFISGGTGKGERCLFVTFEESRGQLLRNATSWGKDFEQMEKEGRLKVLSATPEAAGLDDHALRIRKEIATFQPHRVAVDSLSALMRISTPETFQEFVLGLTILLKQKQIAGFFTVATPMLIGGGAVAENEIGSVVDMLILLRYVEAFGTMRGAISVLKMRGSKHDKEIREFTIDDGGMKIGRAFRNVSGILTGQFHYDSPEETERLEQLFKPDGNE